MIGLIILGILVYFIIICPLVGYVWLHKLKMTEYSSHDSLKELIESHGILAIWWNAGYQMPNVLAGFYITMLLAIIITSIVLMINGI